MTTIFINSLRWFDPPSDITPKPVDHFINGGKQSLKALGLLAAGTIDLLVSIPLVIGNISTAGQNDFLKRSSKNFSNCFAFSGALAFESAIRAINSDAKFEKSSEQMIDYHGNGLVHKYTAQKLRAFAKDLSTSDSKFNRSVSSRMAYLFNLIIVCPLARAADSLIAVVSSLAAFAFGGNNQHLNHLAFRTAQSPAGILMDINNDFTRFIKPRDEPRSHF